MKSDAGKTFTATILSLSFLTIMAGAAVAPALDVLRQHFSTASTTLVQMNVSMPALFIALASLVFPAMTARLRSKSLVLVGLFLYVAGGCGAAVFDNIYIVLVFRALVGIGVGIIMPLSTGLISFYYPKEVQDKMMGYSSAMNLMGGVIATLLSGVLAGISWRACFLVYLVGLVCIILCLMFLPNDDISEKSSLSGTNAKSPQDTKSSLRLGNSVSEFFPSIVGMFLLSISFFVYPTVFAMETVKEISISTGLIAAIMAGMDLAGFFGGLAYASLKGAMKNFTCFLAPILLILGYVFLLFVNGWAGILIGSFFIGFSNGEGTPLIISTASKRAGKNAVSTVLPLLSTSLYIGQFVTPILIGAAGSLFPEVSHISYGAALVFSIFFLVWTIPTRKHFQ